MVERRKLVGGALLALVALAAIWAFATLEERRVKGRFAALAEWVNKAPDEPPLEKVGRARSVGEIFADPCGFEIRAYEVSAEVGLEDLTRMALLGRERFATLELRFYDLEISFPGEDRATARATARLTGTKVEGDAVNETHEVECTLAKTDAGWRFSRITAVEVLQK